jgi:hypothetical protein
LLSSPGYVREKAEGRREDGEQKKREEVEGGVLTSHMQVCA